MNGGIVCTQSGTLNVTMSATGVPTYNFTEVKLVESGGSISVRKTVCGKNIICHYQQLNCKIKSVPRNRDAFFMSYIFDLQITASFFLQFQFYCQAVVEHNLSFVGVHLAILGCDKTNQSQHDTTTNPFAVTKSS